jgi:predicted amidohydrolase
VSAVRIACAQLAPTLGDVEGNRRASLEAIERAVADGAGLVVLPELCSSGYAFADRDEAAAAAEPADGPTVTAWAEAAARHGVVVAGGFAESADGDLHNSAALVDPSGIRAVYRKLHLWDREKLLFRQGTERPPLLDTVAGRIGVGICYDLMFPELTRQLAVAGADVLVFPTNSPLLGPPPGPLPLDVVVAVATAYVNRVFVAVADRCGSERGVEWVGGSVVAAPDGRLLAGPPGADAGPVTVAADCELDDARDKRWGPRNDVLRDRRSDVLGTLQP